MKEESENKINKESEKYDQEPNAHAEELPNAPVDLSQLRLPHGNVIGTSGYGMVNYNPEVSVKHPLEMIAWENECRKVQPDPKKTLYDGIVPLKANFADQNTFLAVCGKYEALWKIQIGKYLNLMKGMAKQAKEKWEPWAEKELDFIGSRNRQRMMYLVSCLVNSF